MEAIRPALVPAPPPAVAAAARPAPVDRVELSSSSDNVQPPKLAEALRRAGKPYYDPGADQKEQRSYYGSLTRDVERMASEQLFAHLSELVTETHKARSYEPSEYLYTWVDLRPNLRLNCIYDPNSIATDAPVRAKPEDFNVTVETGSLRKNGRLKPVKETRSLYKQAQQWAQALSQGPTNALQIAQNIAAIEVKSTFNCEHVIPRIWFQDETPMRGDLHHLFTANQDTNGDRSSRRLADFPEYDGADGKGLAPFGDTRYEPAAGKGAVARATLYFLLRYPRKVGDDPREIQPEDLKTLLEWNRQFPPTLYERHRNAAIQELQGNRNPFIDHPEWADKIDFTKGLQRPLPPGMQAERERRLENQRANRPQSQSKSKRPRRQQRPRPQSSQRPPKNRNWRR